MMRQGFSPALFTMVFDAHMHVGRFYDDYTSPDDVISFCFNNKISSIAISSTSICGFYYHDVLEEMRLLLQNKSGIKVFPVLWVIPDIIDNGILDLFFESSIPWSCIKIHPELNQNTWVPHSIIFSKILDIATRKRLPIMIHTAHIGCCRPVFFIDTFLNYSNITFILAHGRPLDDTLCVLQRCPNVMVDTAFMPVSHIYQLCSHGFTSRILWGSDYPINKYYINQSSDKYYSSLVSKILDSLTQVEAQTIFKDNFLKTFPIIK